MDRRELIKLGAGVIASGFTLSAAGATPTTVSAVEQWCVFEFTAKGSSSGNPFVVVSFGALFTQGHRTVELAGFYDGDGMYKVRFSPDTVGRWGFETTGSAKELTGLTGAFDCVAANVSNRGPVSTAHQFHFQYADGTPYFPFGTTCYSYGFIGEPLDRMTLEDLKSAGFNKVRMCLLPKSLVRRQPVAMPFERIGSAVAATWQEGEESGKIGDRFNLARPNPFYFQNVERRIQDLMDAGVEADVILFHPYDARGFSAMGDEADDRYLRYAVARLAAYRNVWWSIANEYDLEVQVDEGLGPVLPYRAGKRSL